MSADTARHKGSGRDDHTGASTHTAPTLDEWRRSELEDKDAERVGLESTGRSA